MKRHMDMCQCFNQSFSMDKRTNKDTDDRNCTIMNSKWTRLLTLSVSSCFAADIKGDYNHYKNSQRHYIKGH